MMVFHQETKQAFEKLCIQTKIQIMPSFERNHYDWIFWCEGHHLKLIFDLRIEYPIYTLNVFRFR